MVERNTQFCLMVVVGNLPTISSLIFAIHGHFLNLIELDRNAFENVVYLSTIQTIEFTQ